MNDIKNDDDFVVYMKLKNEEKRVVTPKEIKRLIRIAEESVNI